VDNAERRLLPGMVGRVVFELEASQPRLLVPREAVGEEFGLRFVYVLQSEGGSTVVRRRSVVVREVPFEVAVLEVVSGLESGEEVAVSGVALLQDGARVRAARDSGVPSPGAEADRS
jgi:hypothetical protein